MLDEAKLALEENKIPTQKASIFFTKLIHINAFQNDVLKQMRQKVDSTHRPIVDQAINMCDVRGRWVRKMMEEECGIPSGSSDTSRVPRGHPSENQDSEGYQWGPGCDWMR